ncbi:NAD(P)/FAD-dependent oxidoreductase [Paracoccus yeei]|uniref:Pyridine nucleotide-disulfide oxidoreductase n=1 Tax=Paracoccus yeei TaxID=147645 RepID=A0A2D2C1K8_9RHOB|nr:FAD-dependent oxidoreductase [Paracoccus yeei]ATQ56398.1 pyridine nucleotide-disulfide oxidoreductase [Paracoccus yeei]
MTEMLETTASIVVIGAGQAGLAAASKLRDLGHAGPITLVGDEPELPYQRPPLSKAYLLGEMARKRLFLRPPVFYAERDLTLLIGRNATEIRRDVRQVMLSDGSALPYQRLLLAIGARPRLLPGPSLDGVLVMRSLADADRLAQAVRPGLRLLVIGGGYIGLEAAASAVKLGLQVTLVEAAPRILGRVAAVETSDYFRELHRAHGVDLREGVGLAHLTEAAGRVTGAALTDGSHLQADLVVVGIGVLPNVELAQTAGLTCDNGISVDACCRSSDMAIFAAGDCASFPWRGQRIRLESVGNAIDQAEVAAANMLGESREYQAKPWFWSDQFDVKLQIAGLCGRHDRVVTRAGAGAGRSHWYFYGDRLEAVDAMNDPRVFMVAKRVLEGDRPVDAAFIADPANDLRALLAS